MERGKTLQAPLQWHRSDQSQAGAWEASLLPLALLLLPNVTMMDSPNFCLFTCMNNIQVFHHLGWAIAGLAVLSLVLQWVVRAELRAAVSRHVAPPYLK